MKPQKAFKYQDHYKKLSWPQIVQPKLNGVRCVYRDGRYFTNDEKEWRPNVLDHLENELFTLGAEHILDGELYKHGWSLQRINSAISVNLLKAKDKTTEIEYWVFDLIDATNPMAEQSMRSTQLNTLLHLPRWIKVRHVPTYYCGTMAEADYWFHEFVKQGYEGAMYRDPSAPYGFLENCGNQENRWKHILKRKDWLDEEFMCVDIEMGEGKYSQAVGALVLVTAEGVRFAAGSGLTDAQRERYMDNPPIGKLVTVRFEMYTDGGVPYKPTIEFVHED